MPPEYLLWFWLVFFLKVSILKSLISHFFVFTRIYADIHADFICPKA